MTTRPSLLNCIRLSSQAMKGTDGVMRELGRFLWRPGMLYRGSCILLRDLAARRSQLRLRGDGPPVFLRAFLPHARAKKLPRSAECLVYSLTRSGVSAENHPKNRGFVGILRGQKCLRRRFSRRSPVAEWSRGARSMPRVFGRGSRSQPAVLVATATMQLYFRRSGSSRDTVLQNQVERAA